MKRGVGDNVGMGDSAVKYGTAQRIFVRISIFVSFIQLSELW